MPLLQIQLGDQAASVVGPGHKAKAASGVYLKGVQGLGFGV